MMNLTKKDLPNVVEINGRSYLIKTDFRLWMRFEIEVSKIGLDGRVDVSYLFEDEMPEQCNLEELFVFSRPVTELPRAISHLHSDVIAYDYEIDADLIFAAFLGQYGIDLMVEDMHWHKFLALFRGLNDSTRMREVMGYRCYEKQTNKDRDVYDELRQAWEIRRMTAQEKAEEEKFSSYFE